MFLVSLVTPVSALAYLSPEQVFGGSSLTLQSSAPPTAREGSAVVQQQQERSAVQRSAAQQSLTSIDAEPQDTYQPSSAAQSLGLFENETQYDLRMQRIQNSNSGSPTIIIGGDGDIIDANGNVLHSGAPRVSATGPESMLAAIVVVLAGICTFGIALMKNRRIKAGAQLS